MSFPAYPGYKKSGIELLGEIPSEWDAVPLKRIAKITYGMGQPPEYQVDGIPFVRATNVMRGKLSADGLVFVHEDVLQSARATRLVPGDIVVVRSGAYTGDSAIVTQEWADSVAGFDMIVRVHADIDPRYAAASLISPYILDGQINLLRMRAAQPHLNAEELGSVIFVMPPHQEQAAIAAFLDHETAKIDALVVEQERLIALLKEKRQAVISHAVTKGLDPNTPMKDSGVEWLGQVPAHWEVVRVKQVARLESGHTPSKQFPEYWEGGEIEWVSLNDSKHLATNDYISDTAMKITPLGMANSSARLLPEGAVVFTRDATIGLAAITTCPMAVSQHLIAWCPSEAIMSMYLLRVFNVMKAFLDAVTFGAIIKTIGMPEVGKLVTPVPPLSEQRDIVAFVERELKVFDTLTAEAERAVTLLRERRAALISAAVTGKIDVRGFVRPEQQAA